MIRVCTLMILKKMHVMVNACLQHLRSLQMTHLVAMQLYGCGCFTRELVRCLDKEIVYERFCRDDLCFVVEA